MKNYHWNVDSFGSYEIPENAAEIIDQANELIDNYVAQNPDADEFEIDEYSMKLWEMYCNTGTLPE